MIVIKNGEIYLKGKNDDIINDFMNFVLACLNKNTTIYGCSGEQVLNIFNIHSLISMIFSCCIDNKKQYEQVLEEIEKTKQQTYEMLDKNEY